MWKGGVALTLVLLSIASPLSLLPDKWEIYRYALLGDEQAPLQVTPSPSIGLIGAWNKREISVLLYPHPDQLYNEQALEAVRWWTRAIRVFTALYGYEYLNSLKITTYVNGVNGSSGDITIHFVSDLGPRVCGRAFMSVSGNVISYSRVEISLRCVGTDANLVKVVTAHEFGHALGLEHSNNPEDLMYQYVVYNSRPSTLNVYALAVAYSWLRSGSFNVPDSVSLPPSLPFRYLLDANGMPIKIRVRMMIQIDDGPTTLHQELLAEPGNTVTLTANPLLLSGDPMTRYRFLGWFVDGMELSTSESLSFTPRDHVTVVARYISQFLVRIETPLSVTERWYDRGTKIVIETLELIDFGNRTRLRFVKWEGDARTESPRFETTVQRPIGLRAHYVRLYHVRVDLSVLGIWEEWVDDGRELSLEHLIGRTILDFGNGTRLAVSGILDPSSDRTVTKLLVRRPIDTIVVWEKQHLVRVINGWTGAARELWWKENGIVELVTEELVEFGNGTRLSFRGWTGDLTPPHSPRAYLLVKGPTEVTARYVRQYLLTVMSEVSEHASRSWLDEGSRARLRVPAVHELSDGTRYRFIGWSGKVGSNEAEVELLMDGPVVLVSNWVREALVRVRLSPLEEVSLWGRMGSHLTLTAPQTLEYGGSVWVFDGWSDGITVLQRSLEVVSAMELEATYIEARTVRFVIEGHEGSSVIIRYGGRLLDIPLNEPILLPLGRWTVEGFTWKGVVQQYGDIEVVEVDGGVYELRPQRRKITVRVVDALGLPVPGVGVELLNDLEVVERRATTGWDGWVEIEVLGRSSKAIRVEGAGASRGLSSSDEEVLGVPLGFYSWTALAMGAWTSSVVGLPRRKRRESRRGTR